MYTKYTQTDQSHRTLKQCFLKQNEIFFFFFWYFKWTKIFGVGGGRKSVFHNFHLRTSCHKGSAPRNNTKEPHLTADKHRLGFQGAQLPSPLQCRGCGHAGQAEGGEDSLQPSQRLPRYCRVTKSSPHAPAVLPGTHLRRTEDSHRSLCVRTRHRLLTPCNSHSPRTNRRPHPGFLSRADWKMQWRPEHQKS